MFLLFLLLILASQPPPVFSSSSSEATTKDGDNVTTLLIITTNFNNTEVSTTTTSIFEYSTSTEKNAGNSTTTIKTKTNQIHQLEIIAFAVIFLLLVLTLTILSFYGLIIRKVRLLSVKPFSTNFYLTHQRSPQNAVHLSVDDISLVGAHFRPEFRKSTRKEPLTSH